MKSRRHHDPRPLCAAVRSTREGHLRTWWLLAALGAAAALWLASVPAARAEPAPSLRRVDILLDPTALPPTDRAASQDRWRAISEARASGLPLFRSFDPRETLRETLAVLHEKGVDVGPSAIVNFDSIEAWMPAKAKKELARLPFVKKIRTPVAPVPAGLFDSEGIELTGADLAHLGATAPPVTGAGLTIAIIDKDYEVLAATIASPDDELYPIPITDMWEQKTSNSSDFNNVDLDSKGDREHGTASAEVIYEMAPDATILLYAVKSTAGIEYAIGHAVAQGADIIHIPLTHIETMGDPVSTAAGGTNRFTDDIDAAVAAGTIVVVAAGNEAKRHLNTEYTPCEECVAGHPQYLCNDANDNDQYHKFSDPFEEMALNALTFDDDHYDAEVFELTCWSAIEAGFDPTDFEMQLYSFDEGSPNFEPLCPGDSGATPVSGTARNLGGFFSKTINIFDADFDEQLYYIAVRYKNPSNPLPDWPNFRIACGTGVDEFLFASTPGSLSDLAVVESAITVAEVDAFFEDEVTDTSSHGPALSGPQKPEIAGPGAVENFAVQEFDFVADWTFNGTSAASAHVAGIVALMQEYRADNGLAPLTPAQAKQWLENSALDVEDVGVDDKVGYGLAQVPVSIYEGDVGPLDFYAVTPCRAVDTRFDPGPDGPTEPLMAKEERSFALTGTCGIPSTARAVSGILSVVSPTAAGFVTLFPGDEIFPGSSSVNFGVGGVINNNIFLKLASNGTGTFRAYTPTGSSDFIFDVNGYFQ